MSSYRFRRVNVGDAEMLLSWRTRADITRYMFTDLEHASVEKQQEWIESCEGREDYRHFIALQDEIPVGYVSYGEIDKHNRHCVSGAYIADASARTGLGAFLIWFVHDYAFYSMGMNKVRHIVMDINKPILRSHKFHKYHFVGVLQQHILKNGQYHDVHLFEMLKEDWEKRPYRPYSLEQSVSLFEDY